VGAGESILRAELGWPIKGAAPFGLVRKVRKKGRAACPSLPFGIFLPVSGLFFLRPGCAGRGFDLTKT